MNAVGGVSMVDMLVDAGTDTRLPLMENRQIVIPIPSRVRAPSKEQRTTNSQQAPNSAPLVQTKEFKPQAKHHFLPVNPMEDSAEVRRA